MGSGNLVPISQQWLLVRRGARGQQIYNTGLGKCLDVCIEQPPSASLCGHAGNVYLQVRCSAIISCTGYDIIAGLHTLS